MIIAVSTCDCPVPVGELLQAHRPGCPMPTELIDAEFVPRDKP
jgi:hypothetical protein